MVSRIEFTAPVAVASTYCTVTEHLFSNIGPILLGILLLRSHWVSMIQFFCTLELGTLCTHSGYKSVSPSPLSRPSLPSIYHERRQ